MACLLVCVCVYKAAACVYHPAMLQLKKFSDLEHMVQMGSTSWLVCASLVAALWQPDMQSFQGVCP